MHTRLAAAALALLLAFPFPVARAQVPHIEYRVRIEAPRELAGMLREGLALERWQGDPQMTEALLERLTLEARENVREAVATRGYFSARVSSTIDRSTKPWTVVLRVEPGAPARVAGAEISFSGPATADPEASGLLERIRRDWKLPAGARFTQDAWDDAKRNAVRTLAGWRYAAAEVADSRALIDPRAGEARLSVQIASGPAFRYGPLQVRGTQRYPESMVARLSPVRAGATYDREELRLYERRLLGTGYFLSAQAGILTEPQSADAAPVRVAVIEGNSQNVETGLSFNTDVGPRVETRYRNMDIFDSAWRFKSELQLDSRIQQGRLDLDAPPYAGGQWENGFAQARRSTIQHETTTELAGGVAHNWGLGGAPSALYVSGHLEEQRVSGLLTDHRHAVFSGYRTQWRDTDSWESPRRGYIVELSAGGAPAVLASQQFTRGTARVALFVPLGSDDFLLRAQVGAVIAPTTLGIPSSFLFRTGGDQTIRGYAFESLGVRRGDAVLGARYLAVGSAEYIHWFGESWGLAAFADGGNAWDGGRFEPVLGYGTGVRFRTPIGPVRGDVAYGAAERQWRLHFSVGLTF